MLDRPPSSRGLVGRNGSNDGEAGSALPRLRLRCTFPAAGTAAVSGGADSLAMLALAVDAGVRVVEAVHVDHGLRPGSADEADVVRDAAAELGVPFRAERVVVARGPNVEARARAARFAAIGEGLVMTGHTADDQAETMLLNLLRGAGTTGIAAMAPGPSKPILALRRGETRAVCASMGWTPVADPSNEDPSFRRNRIRHEVLPLLDRIAGRDVAALLARSASLARDDDALLDDLAAAVTTLSAVVQHADRLRERLGRPAPTTWATSLDDATRQLARLVFPGMVVSHGTDRLRHLPRYLEALDLRLDKLRESPTKDLDKLGPIAALERDLAAAVATHGLTAALDEVRWLVEELRVQVFAQQLGTATSVSEKRIRERLRRAG